MSVERFEVCLWTFFQADRAREFGARVYCVGVMDFDHQQVGEGWRVNLFTHHSDWLSVSVFLHDCFV